MPKKHLPSYIYSTLSLALARVKQQQFLYEQNLVGKSFLYLYLDTDNTIRFKELKFDKENYLHLTGLDYQNRQTLKRNGQPNIGSNSIDFYNRLSQNDSTLINDVSFIKGSTPDKTALFFKYTQHKLDNLSQLTTISSKAEYIGRYSGEQDFDIIINKNLNSIAFKQDGEIYIPVSSLFGNAKDVASGIKPIIAIFSKSPERDYRIEFLNGKVNIGKKLLSDELLSKLNLNSFENSKVKFNSTALDKLVLSYRKTLDNSISNAVDNLTVKRSCVFDNSSAMETYIKAFENFLDTIDSKEKAAIALEKIKKQVDNDNTGLTGDEIFKIEEKFSDLPVPLVKDNKESLSTAVENVNVVQSPVALLKNKINNFAVFPQKNRSELSTINLHSALFQGNTIALAMPNPQPSFEEIIRNTIAQLSDVAQKITKFLSSSIHSFAQEQPPQARTAHERKINSELPFPKQKPADERTEPVTAKQEKARKPEVKPSEKQSSWIGNLISSARSESDAHNKNHEPKAHDKDKSL